MKKEIWFLNLLVFDVNEFDSLKIYGLKEIDFYF